TDAGPALANLYSGLVNIPSKGILEAVEEISAIPEDALSSRDRALRRAAEVVAQEVLRRPVPDSLAQATVSTPVSDKLAEDAAAGTGSGESPFAMPVPEAVPEVAAAGEDEASSEVSPDPA